MSAEILKWDGITKLDLPVDTVLDAAKDAKLKSVFIAGYEKDGTLYLASTIADGAELNWMLDKAKFQLLNISDDCE